MAHNHGTHNAFSRHEISGARTKQVTTGADRENAVMTRLARFASYDSVCDGVFTEHGVSGYACVTADFPSAADRSKTLRRLAREQGRGREPAERHLAEGEPEHVLLRRPKVLHAVRKRLQIQVRNSLFLFATVDLSGALIVHYGCRAAESCCQRRKPASRTAQRGSASQQGG
jgi:hypothetical protein